MNRSSNRAPEGFAADGQSIDDYLGRQILAGSASQSFIATRFPPDLPAMFITNGGLSGGKSSGARLNNLL